MEYPHADYLQESLRFDKRKETIDWIISQIKLEKIKFDGFLVTGLSGVILGSIVANRMRKALVVVRKGENRHSDLDVEVGYTPSKRIPKRLIFLDDLICEAETIKRVAATLKREDYCPKNVVAALLYFDTEVYLKSEVSSLKKCDKNNAIKKLFSLDIS